MKRVVIKKLVWDAWNIKHIASHHVVPEEVEDVCYTGNAQHEEANKGRIRVTGVTQKGHILSAFLDPEPEEGVYYVVSARPASRPERKDYQAWVERGEKAA